MKRLALAAMIIAGTQFAGTNAEHPTHYPSSVTAHRIPPGQSYMCPRGHLHVKYGCQSRLAGIPVVNDLAVTQGLVSYLNSNATLLSTTPPLPATANDGLPVVAGSTSKSSFITSKPPEIAAQTTPVEIGLVQDEAANIAPAKAVTPPQVAVPVAVVRPRSAPQSDPDAVNEAGHQITSETVSIEPIKTAMPEPTAAILAESKTKPEALETSVKQTTQQSVSADQPAESTLAGTVRTDSSSWAPLPPFELDDETQLFPARSLTQEIAAYFGKLEREALRENDSSNADFAVRGANEASKFATVESNKPMVIKDKIDRTEVTIPLSSFTTEQVIAQTQVVAKTPDSSQTPKTRRETLTETQRLAVKQQVTWSETENKVAPPKASNQGSLHRDQPIAAPALELVTKKNEEVTPAATTPVSKNPVAGKVAATTVIAAGSKTDTLRSDREARQILTATGRPWWWLPSMLLAPCGIWALSRRRFGKKQLEETDRTEVRCEIDRTDRPHSQAVGHRDSLQSDSLQGNSLQGHSVASEVVRSEQPELANGPEPKHRQAIVPFGAASLSATTPQANTLASSNFDDFTKIDGVDSRTSAWLHGQGFHRFEHLKEADPKEIQRRLCDWNPEYKRSDVASWIQRAGIAESNSDRHDHREIGSSNWTRSPHEARVVSPDTSKADETSRRRRETIEQTAAKASQSDDLTRIAGICPAVEKLLRKSGIQSFRDLADADTCHLQKVLHSGGARFELVNPQTWAHQAKLACNNDWTSRKLRASQRQQAPPQTAPQQTRSQQTLTEQQEWTPDSTQLSSSDDLTLISGIGPATQEVLNENGIYRLEQVAVMSEQQLSEMFEGHFSLASPESWGSQATEILSQMGDLTVESNLLREVRALKNSKTSDVSQKQLKE